MLKGYFCVDCGADGYIKAGVIPKTCKVCGGKKITGVKMSKNWVREHMADLRACGLQVVVNVETLFREPL